MVNGITLLLLTFSCQFYLVTIPKGATASDLNVITIGGNGAVISKVGSSTLGIYKEEQLVIAGEVETKEGADGAGGGNILLAGAVSADTYGAGGSVKITGKLTINAYSQLQGGNIFKNAATVGSTGQIVVKPNGSIVQTGTWGKHLITRKVSGEESPIENNNSRFVWGNESTDLIVNFTTKKINYPTGMQINHDTSFTHLGIPTDLPGGWNQVTP
ncbi:MAG: hypothetical protein LBT00_07730 [Spirochaetaceae bacterium]|jgi:hypothetical protein|nr:hypothetical protein [Spirochaetaceae bacterium]